MPVTCRKSGAARFRGLQARLEGECAIPVGCTPEPAPFADVGLPFFDNGYEFPPGDDDVATRRSRTAGWSYPRVTRGSTAAHRGKCMVAIRVSICSDCRCLGRCHCMRLGRGRLGWGCVWEP